MSPLILSWRKSTLKLLVSIWPPFPLRQETLSFLCRSHYYVYVLVHSVLPLWYLPNNWGERAEDTHLTPPPPPPLPITSIALASQHQQQSRCLTPRVVSHHAHVFLSTDGPGSFLFFQAFSAGFASADFFSRWRAPSLWCKVQNARFQSRENSDPFWDHLSMCVTSFYLVAYPISQSHLCVNADTQKNTRNITF